MREEILKALEELRKNSKKRNFVQSVDLIINLKGIDVKRPENRINEDLILPFGRGEDAKIAVFTDTFRNLKGVDIYTSKDIEEIAKNKREIKKLAKKYDFFLAEPQLMPLIGKYFGKYFAPRGKMPRPIRGDPQKMVDAYKKSINIRMKNAPVIQCLVGKENMEDEKIARNIEEVLKFVISKLPKERANIKNVLIKFTMSKPVKVKVI
ncbi:MAG: 50S ribosomal protein L1 [Candidatus Aenigmarchaeota archaeon ex4484_224]|nr:MAG: 50S ribosomal protein L1 [Candidatus Aenigmarchaeota archaeon ex4484_224]